MFNLEREFHILTIKIQGLFALAPHCIHQALMLFVDFSSAFSTVLSHMLIEKTSAWTAHCAGGQ